MTAVMLERASDVTMVAWTAVRMDAMDEKLAVVKAAGSVVWLAGELVAEWAVQLVVRGVMMVAGWGWRKDARWGNYLGGSLVVVSAVTKVDDSVDDSVANSVGWVVTMAETMVASMAGNWEMMEQKMADLMVAWTASTKEDLTAML